MATEQYFVSVPVGIKPKLPCMSMWKAYAPTIMMSEDALSDKRLVCIKKLSEASTSG